MTPLPGLAAVAPRWMALDVDMDGYIPKASLGLPSPQQSERTGGKMERFSI